MKELQEQYIKIQDYNNIDNQKIKDTLNGLVLNLLIKLNDIFFNNMNYFEIETLRLNSVISSCLLNKRILSDINIQSNICIDFIKDTKKIVGEYTDVFNLFLTKDLVINKTFKNNTKLIENILEILQKSITKNINIVEKNKIEYKKTLEDYYYIGNVSKQDSFKNIMLEILKKTIIEHITIYLIDYFSKTYNIYSFNLNYKKYNCLSVVSYPYTIDKIKNLLELKDNTDEIDEQSYKILKNITELKTNVKSKLFKDYIKQHSNDIIKKINKEKIIFQYIDEISCGHIENDPLKNVNNNIMKATDKILKELRWS